MLINLHQFFRIMNMFKRFFIAPILRCKTTLNASRKKNDWFFNRLVLILLVFTIMNPLVVFAETGFPEADSGLLGSNTYIIESDSGLIDSNIDIIESDSGLLRLSTERIETSSEVTTSATVKTYSTTTKTLTANNAMETYIFDTVNYPDVFTYNIGRDPEIITDILFRNPSYNLMLALSATEFAYKWTGFAGGDYTLRITPVYFDSTEQRAAVRIYVDRVAVELFQSGMTEYDKLAAVNDYLIKTFEYDQTYTKYSVYPFITTKSGVCQAYAQLAVMLLRAGDVQAYPISGISDGVAHAWVSVRINGAWYEFDPTYNDNLGYQTASTRVEYLMKTHSDMVFEGRSYDDFAAYTYDWMQDSVTEPVVTEVIQTNLPSVWSVVFPNHTFSDVLPNQWYSEAVQYIGAIGLMVGSEGKFYPDQAVTIAQVITVAARVHAFEHQNEEIMSEFIKVYAEQSLPWYQAYIDYCKMYNIIKGNEFGSSWENRFAKREEMAYILERATENVSAIQQLAIPDIDSVNSVFRSGVITMANAGIITGVDAKNTFKPKDTATRAQLAMILFRLVK